MSSLTQGRNTMLNKRSGYLDEDFKDFRRTKEGYVRYMKKS